MLYENQYIGAFLYSLGVTAGRKKVEVADSVNLFQQTPADKTFGDILGQWQGKNFLVEFKRSENGVELEYRKPRRLKLIRAINGGDKKLHRVSAKSHFIAYPKTERNKELLLFHPYVYIKSDRISSTHFNEFVLSLGDPDSKVGVSDAREFEEYLRFMIRVADGEEAPGILINASANGSIHFVVYTSLQELNRKIRLIKSRELGNGIKPEDDLGPRMGPRL